MDVKLHVGNLAYTTSENDLRILFSQAGTVNSVDLILDRDTGKSKGYAFVTMASQLDAQKAITMFEEFTIHEREMKVSVAKPREDRAGQGGPGGRSAAFGPRGAVKQVKHKRRGGNRRY